MQKKQSNILPYILLSVAVIFFMGCLMSSCGKSTVLPAPSNTQYQVINLSPDLLPVDLYIDNTKNNSVSYSYPFPSGYFALTSIDTPFQIRSSSVVISTNNILSIDTVLKNNLKYTLFITGLRNSNPSIIGYILTKDSSSLAKPGRGKIRFINASPGAPPISLTANGTTAFLNNPYGIVTKFIELPAGIYDFQAITPTNVLKDVPNITVQDGKLYTLYSYGIIGRTDSAAFSVGILNNN